MADSIAAYGSEVFPQLSTFQRTKRRLLSSYSGMGALSPTISGFTFDSAARLYYFGSLAPTDPESILMLNTEGSGADMESLQPVQVLEPDCAHDVDRNWTPEQELLFERKRIAPKPIGIDSFEIEPTSGRFLMTAGTNLLLGTLSGADDMIASERLSLIHAVNAQLCPSHPGLLAFVRQSNLHLSHLSTSQEFKVSDISPDEVAAGISAGMASFLVQEDMDRYQGFWWRPPVASEKSQTYYLLYEVVDDHDVNVKQLYHPLTGSVAQQRYPIPGGPISNSDLLLAEFSLTETEESPGAVSISLKRRRLSHPLWELIPGAGYLARAGWLPSGNSVWIQLISRSQQELRLIEIPLSCFRTAEEWETSSLDPHTALKLLFLERSEFWINCSELFSILPTKDSFQFIIASSITDFQHLYHVAVPSTLPPDVKSSPSGTYALQDLTSVCEVTQLTQGEWIVDKQNIWVDHINKLVYYMACSVTPTEQHLHVSSYSSNQPHKVLTQPGYYVECNAMDSLCKYAVLTYSNLTTCPEIRLCKINSSQNVSEVELLTLKVLHKSVPYPPTYSVPQIHTFKNSKGVDLYCMHSTPQHTDADKKYPLVVYVYGGPMFRMVKNEFSGEVFRMQMLVDQGLSVLITDNTGSCGRGLQFEGAIKHKMGQVEVLDQVEAIEFVEKTTQKIDMNRISIFGWSYGGYMSFLSLAQRPDIFRVAVCGGTVQDWSIYESAYTEKYMGTPDSNPEGYKRGRGEYYVSGLPEESGRLLFLHGQIDENVHFTHVENLISSILAAGIPYQLNVFPGERHGVRGFASRIQMLTSVMCFIKEGLKVSCET